MAFENENGELNEKPTDDLRSALAAAIATSAGEASEKAADTPAKPAAPKKGEAVKASEERAPEAGAGEEAESIKPEAETATGEAAEKSEDDEAKTKAAESAKAETALTGRWSAKDKETFKALPPEGKDLFLRRHKEMEGAFVRKTQEIAAFRKEYEPVHKLLEPWADRMKTRGYTPSSLITAWANVEKRLMDGDGVGVVAGLIKGYSLDMGKIAQALGLRPLPRDPAAADGVKPPLPNGDGSHIQLPPELTQQLHSLQQRLDAADRERADRQRFAETSAVAKAEADLEAFKSAQDDKGNLLHPHFDDLEDDMLQLAQAAIAARKPVPPLMTLYETAVWANPSTRKAKLAADQKAQQAKAADEARAKAAAAKKAASSVTGAPGAGHAPASRTKGEPTLREQLLEAAAERESAL
jgi:hypothetical protein